MASCTATGAKRRAADLLTGTLSMSEPLASKAVGFTRSTYRRPPATQTPDDPDAKMRARLHAYTTRYPAIGRLTRAALG